MDDCKNTLFYLLLNRNRGHETIYLLSPLKSRVWSLRPAFLGEPFSTGLLWRRTHLEQSQKQNRTWWDLPPVPCNTLLHTALSKPQYFLWQYCEIILW